MYYLGDDTTFVKPVRRRVVGTRRLFPKREQRYLVRQGRQPVNRRGYPTLGVPLAIDMSMEPGRGAYLGQALQVLPTGFTGFQSTFTSSAPSPQAAQDTGLLSSLVNLWNERPQILKQIRIRVKPKDVMQAVQTAVPAGQVTQAVNQLRAVGIDPRLMTAAGEMPITGQEAGIAYRAAGTDWQQYLPWIIGGGVALLALPALAGGR